jgi:hypothetical protein
MGVDPSPVTRHPRPKNPAHKVRPRQASLLDALSGIPGGATRKPGTTSGDYELMLLADAAASAIPTRLRRFRYLPSSLRSGGRLDSVRRVCWNSHWRSIARLPPVRRSVVTPRDRVHTLARVCRAVNTLSRPIFEIARNRRLYSPYPRCGARIWATGTAGRSAGRRRGDRDRNAW